jgi:hypothetical protein
VYRLVARVAGDYAPADEHRRAVVAEPAVEGDQPAGHVVGLRPQRLPELPGPGRVRVVGEEVAVVELPGPLVRGERAGGVTGLLGPPTLPAGLLERLDVDPDVQVVGEPVGVVAALQQRLGTSAPVARSARRTPLSATCTLLRAASGWALPQKTSISTSRGTGVSRWVSR